jgi:hypothetical protein
MQIAVTGVTKRGDPETILGSKLAYNLNQSGKRGPRDTHVFIEFGGGDTRK